MRCLTLMAILAATCVGCGDSPTGPSAGTRVEARIQDSPSSSPTITGTLAGNFSASVWDGNRWIDLGSPNGITVALQSAGASTTVHGEQSVATGSYGRVRLVLQGVTARVARGSTIGGTTLTTDTTVTLGGSDQRVEISVSVDSFLVESDPSMRRAIVFDLRSNQWLTIAAVQTGQVDDASLQAAVTASTRAERR